MNKNQSVRSYRPPPIDIPPRPEVPKYKSPTPTEPFEWDWETSSKIVIRQFNKCSITEEKKSPMDDKHMSIIFFDDDDNSREVFIESDEFLKEENEVNN